MTQKIENKILDAAYIVFNTKKKILNNKELSILFYIAESNFLEKEFYSIFYSDFIIKDGIPYFPPIENVSFSSNNQNRNCEHLTKIEKTILFEVIENYSDYKNNMLENISCLKEGSVLGIKENLKILSFSQPEISHILDRSNQIIDMIKFNEEYSYA